MENFQKEKRLKRKLNVSCTVGPIIREEHVTIRQQSDVILVVVHASSRPCRYLCVLMFVVMVVLMFRFSITHTETHTLIVRLHRFPH